MKYEACVSHPPISWVWPCVGSKFVRCSRCWYIGRIDYNCVLVMGRYRFSKSVSDFVFPVFSKVDFRFWFFKISRYWFGFSVSNDYTVDYTVNPRPHTCHAAMIPRLQHSAVNVKTRSQLPRFYCGNRGITTIGITFQIFPTRFPWSFSFSNHFSSKFIQFQSSYFLWNT